ncbi:hypothetical protein TGAM01_v209991 [Trichoderma gamsii]|uniref:Uncharacterized protein n=1 Tax=Trichoderma gamsii TaxID=398673 RepID=A0A2P4ZA10_9HYPO|nr:hypothetical protein TGAM01_v209991 [Trichoderma gamsii]PON21143.1 hypothetical protein TGAM01_v209991 [Trichoderma gamsii]
MEEQEPHIFLRHEAPDFHAYCQFTSFEHSTCLISLSDWHNDELLVLLVLLKTSTCSSTIAVAQRQTVCLSLGSVPPSFNWPKESPGHISHECEIRPSRMEHKVHLVHTGGLSENIKSVKSFRLLMQRSFPHTCGRLCSLSCMRIPSSRNL